VGACVCVCDCGWVGAGVYVCVRAFCSYTVHIYGSGQPYVFLYVWFGPSLGICSVRG